MTLWLLIGVAVVAVIVAAATSPPPRDPPTYRDALEALARVSELSRSWSSPW